MIKKFPFDCELKNFYFIFYFKICLKKISKKKNRFLKNFLKKITIMIVKCIIFTFYYFLNNKYLK